jgi:hypothetical protein
MTLYQLTNWEKMIIYGELESWWDREIMDKATSLAFLTEGSEEIH